MLNLGIIILCPDGNLSGVSKTLISAQHNSYHRECMAIISDSADVKEMKGLCPVHRGRETITSLINVGMHKLKQEWGLLVFAGSRFQHYFERKLSIFVKSEYDVLFPVIGWNDGKMVFETACFNGVLINKKFFEKIGDFPEDTEAYERLNDFEMAKLFWCAAATQQGGIFKGVVGLQCG